MFRGTADQDNMLTAVCIAAFVLIVSRVRTLFGDIGVGVIQGKENLSITISPLYLV